LIKTNGAAPVHGKLVWLAGLILALLLAIASPLASSHPDGLMWVARQYGFTGSEQNPLFKIIPHYIIPGVRDKTLATILAAIIGTLIVLAVALGVAYLRRRKADSHSDNQL
jgi:ABC-type Fe3+ transport system permease subunit